jgi:hypothetical protein
MRSNKELETIGVLLNQVPGFSLASGIYWLGKRNPAAGQIFSADRGEKS